MEYFEKLYNKGWTDWIRTDGRNWFILYQSVEFRRKDTAHSVENVQIRRISTKDILNSKE